MTDHNQKSPQNPVQAVFEAEDQAQKRGEWAKEFIHYYWPIMFFGTLFLFMCMLPMALMDAPLFIPALGLAIVFGLAVTFIFTQPLLLPPLIVLAVTIVAFAYPELGYNKAGVMLGTWMFGAAIFGWMYFSKKIATPDGEQDDAFESPTPLMQDSMEAESIVQPAASEESKKGPKPVAFDLSIAAKGVTIVFGTESGNAEDLANTAKDKLEGDGHAVQVLDAETVDVTHLGAFANLLIITSTWGEGDPPSNAIDLVEGLKSDGVPHDFSGIQYSVMALGDTNYELFCQCGKDFDTLLEKYGAKRFVARKDADVDFEEPFDAWFAEVQGVLKGGLNSVAEFVEPQQEVVTEEPVEAVVEDSKVAEPVSAAETPAGETVAVVESEPQPAADEAPVGKYDADIAAKGVTIVFGTESGNAEDLAGMAKESLEGDGLQVQVLDAGDVKAMDLKNFANLLIITSTWGEGDPPSNAIDLIESLKDDSQGHDFKGIQFSVLALGDTSYEQFCQCGKDFDTLLEKYGAERFAKRVDCDVDFEEPYESWIAEVQGTLKNTLKAVAV